MTEPEAATPAIVTTELAPRASEDGSLRTGEEWTIWDVAWVAGVFVLALVASAFIGLPLARLFPAFRGQDESALAGNPLVFVPIQFAAYLIAFLFARMMITVKTQKDFWQAVEWNLPSASERLALILVGLVMAFAVQSATRFLPIPKQLPVERYFRTPEFAYMMLTFGIAVAPLAEELFFRGLLFPACRRLVEDARSLAAIGTLCWIFAGAIFIYAWNMNLPVSKWLAIFGYAGAGFILAAAIARRAPEIARGYSLAASVIGTSLLFSLVHQGQLAQAWAPLLMLFLVGLALTLTRFFMHSLAASWLLHASYNGTLFLMLLLGTHGFRNLDRISP